MIKDKKQIVKICVLAVLIIAMIVVTIILWPKVMSLRNPETREQFQQYIESLGFKGVLLMLGIVVLQIVVAFIPGEPIEVMAGFLYGTWGGLAICLIGSLIGSAIIFLLVKLLGKNWIQHVVDSEKFQKYQFLKNPTKRDSMIFLLFFIIGTPKDVLTYFAPFTGISVWRFLAIISIAKIPAIISSTMAGSSLGQGNIVKTIIIFAVAAILGMRVSSLTIKLWLNTNKIKNQTKRIVNYPFFD